MALRDLMSGFAHNLRAARWWIAAQFLGFPLIALAFIGWTRLPEKHWWQVALSLLLPLVLLAAALVLKAGAVRRMMSESQPRAPLFWGALSLLVWIAIAWFVWALLDKWDDKIFLWSGYLSSKAPAGWRARLFTYQHLFFCFTRIEWFLRWIVLPALLIPFGTASAVSAWRLIWRAAFRVLCDWRWLLAALVLGFLGVDPSGESFHSAPHGTLAAQIWALVFKITYAYVWGFVCWILLLAWACTLLKHAEAPKLSEPEP